MKKSLTLVLAILMFVVLGCSLDSLTKKDDAPKTTDKPDATTDKPDTTTDKPTDNKPSGSSDGKAELSIDKFNKMKLDMSYEDVKGIIGADGKERSSSTYGDTVNKSYQWKGEKNASISASFKNDKLISMSQFSLTDSSGNADVTLDKMNKIQLGMSYDAVKKIVGSDGEMTSTSKFGKSVNSNYVWKGKKFSRIRATFKDDKLTNKSQSGLN